MSTRKFQNLVWFAWKTPRNSIIYNANSALSSEASSLGWNRNCKRESEESTKPLANCKLLWHTWLFWKDAFKNILQSRRVIFIIFIIIIKFLNKSSAQAFRELWTNGCIVSISNSLLSLSIISIRELYETRKPRLSYKNRNFERKHAVEKTTVVGNYALCLIARREIECIRYIVLQ